MWATDFLAIWGLKGKIIFATASIPARLFHDPALGWSHPEYPMLLPLTFASIAAALREWDDYAMALLYPLCQAATVLAVWGLLRRRASDQAPAAGGCLTALCSPLYSAAHIGLADIPLALGFVLLCGAALDVTESASLANRTRLLVASFFCAALKQEGTLMVILFAATLAFRARSGDRRSRLVWLWAVCPVVAHGLLLSILRGSVSRSYIDLSLLEPAR
ncbi:MAG TPA: hypothetical protein VEG84_09835, partial [Thermoanaerobaculia bacterium]|nr:hypothetical protein [Thermoanaerobaculia bacterium]